MSIRSLFSALVVTFALGANAVVLGPTSTLYIGNKIISPDGFARPAALAGASPNSLTLPGPVITAVKGSNSAFRINVVNQLQDPLMLTGTSIHWHGFVQKGTTWADGAASVTQCPIASGHSFVYQFALDDHAGTFWYHSHYSTQYCDGLLGVMVVYDPLDPYRAEYDIDDESTIITLGDWYHDLSYTGHGRIPSVSNTTLVNGLGRYPTGPATPLAVVQVLANKRYRFRVVNLACDSNFKFSIDGHTMVVIEADAQNVQALVVDQFQIFAGQRYSVIVKTNQPIGNYWIRAEPNESGPTGTNGDKFQGGINSAILRYVGAPNADPKSSSSVSNPLFETNLHPLSNPAAPGVPKPGAADVVLNLSAFYDRPKFKFLVNGVAFSPPNVPVILQILSGAQTAQDLLPPGSVYTLPPNKVIEISMPQNDLPGSPHPMHLHGHAFSVVRSAGSPFYNFANPVRRDVVSLGEIGSKDNVTIRFTTDNPGPWIMHCHIDWHIEMGFSVVFAEDVPSIAASTQPPDWDQLCPIFHSLPPSSQ